MHRGPGQVHPGSELLTGRFGLGMQLREGCHQRQRPFEATLLDGRADVPSSVEVRSGDLTDPRFASDAVAGAAVAYQCLNPPYHRWAEEFPGLQDAAVSAARSVGAKLVSFENTYMCGDTQGEPLTETTPVRAHTRKGRVRATMADQLRALHESGDLRVATARASDHFGPHGTTQSPLGDLAIGAALAGTKARVMGDPDQLHSYKYTVDAARTLAALGARDDVDDVDDVDGEIFHVPNAPAQTTRQIVDMVAEQLDSHIKVSTAPRLLLRLLGLFNPTVRELDEMRYEFTQPFIVEDTKAQERSGRADPAGRGAPGDDQLVRPAATEVARAARRRGLRADRRPCRRVTTARHQGVRPVKAMSLVTGSASSGTSTRGPKWSPWRRISSIGSIPSYMAAAKSTSIEVS